MGTCRCTRRYDGAVEAGLSDDVDLDGGIAARVVDGAGVDLGDGHASGSGLAEECQRYVQLDSGEKQGNAQRNRGKRIGRES